MGLQFIIVYILLMIILLYGLKTHFNEKKIELAMNNLNNLRGFFAVLIILSHFIKRLNIVPTILFPIQNISTISVSFFFLMSGYGLVYQFLNKKDYMKNFLTRKYLNIEIVLFGFLFMFYISEIISYLLYGDRITCVSINWYIIEIVLLYFIFYCCYSL